MRPAIVCCHHSINMSQKEKGIKVLVIGCLSVAFLVLYRNSFESVISSMSKGNYKKGLCIVPLLTDFDQFYSYFETPKASCNHMEQIGGIRFGQRYLDGDKWVCFDNGFKPDDCVVYSFGVNNEWSFEDSMDLKRYCKVFAFDPTMGRKDHNRSSRISYFNLGISNQKGLITIGGKKVLVDRYKGIVEKLGHRSTMIDYLKIDIEGHERDVFKDILDNDPELLDNVRQIGLEIHIGKAEDAGFKKAKQLWDIFHRLECLGWRLLSSALNQVAGNHFSFRGVTRSTCYELVWIKN